MLDSSPLYVRGMGDHGRKIGGPAITGRAQDAVEGPASAPRPGKQTLVQLSVAATPATAPALQTEPAAPAGPVPELPSYASIARLFGGRVQARSAAGSGAPDMHAAAAQGISGPASPLPHLEQIQRSFGRHDVSQVQAHTGEAATAGARAIGAEAFATGDHIAFAGSPSLHLAAHEATHVVQQRGGVQLTGGVGQAGDPYEQHADRVADAVVRGESAERLLDQKQGPPVERAGIQRKPTPPAAPDKEKAAAGARGRSPTSEDLRQLAEYDLTRQVLERQRRDKVAEVANRVDTHLVPYQHQLEDAKQKGASADELEMGRGYIAERKQTFVNWVKQVDEAIEICDREQAGYRAAMNAAHPGERVVWHSSAIGAGWLPEHLSQLQREAEAEPAWQLGFKTGQRYVLLRDQGLSPSAAIFKVAGIAVGDLTGVTNLVEAVSGHEVITGRDLPPSERWLKGVLGVVGVASLLTMVGPRIGGFLRSVGGARVAFVQPSGALGGAFPVLIVAESQATLAITEAEVAVLVANGVLQMSSLGGSSGSGPKAPAGLKGTYGPARGGGGDASAKQYAKKVTGREDSVYVDDVEFDGWRATDKTLLDAKLSSGEGSWYDVTGTDRFTKDFKIPEILKQARRQLSVLSGSGAARIEWAVSDPAVVRSLRALFRAEQVNITVVHVAP